MREGGENRGSKYIEKDLEEKRMFNMKPKYIYCQDKNDEMSLSLHTAWERQGEYMNEI